MTEFSKQNRAKPLWHTVAFHDVPMFRALALALDHAQDHGAQFAVFSADRRDNVLRRFNAAHGTNLHGQKYLYDHQHERGFYPANPPGKTSHCLRSDGNPAYRVDHRVIPPGGALPKYMLGIDVVDHGSANDCSRLVGILEHLGYHVTRPYHTGSEAHHMCFVNDPTPVLRHWNHIPKQS